MTPPRTPTGESAPVSLQELRAEARALAGKYFPDRRRFAYRRYRGAGYTAGGFHLLPDESAAQNGRAK